MSKSTRTKCTVRKRPLAPATKMEEWKMFDKLIESNSKGTNASDRRGYFAVSTVFMSLVLIAGLLASIYGANFDIGNGDLDVSQLLAPLETNAPEPKPAPKPESQPEQQKESTELPMRTAVVQQITETPNKIVPVATAPVDFKERPDGRFEMGPVNLDPPNAGYVAGVPGGTGSNPPNGSGDGSDSSVSTRTIPPPPPIEKPKVNPNTIVSLGAVNGKALTLPKPAYPPAAKMVRAEGAVQIQITIDTNGSVVSAKALNGHPTLRTVAERAAMGARFSPTKLSNVPVKATGIITYNFKLG